MIRAVFVNTLSAFVLLTADAAVANAPPTPPPANAQGPCFGDIQKFCPDVPIGNGRRIICLEKHLPQLAPLCAKRVPIMRKLFDYGQESSRKTDAYLAKKEAADKAAAAAAAKAHAPAPPNKPK